MSELGPAPSPESLQFQHAEPLPEAVAGSGPFCVICKRQTGNTYFHAQGHVVCPMCAGRIESGQQAPAAVSLARAFLYGAGAALGGCLMYAAVSIVTGLEIGLIAIVVGVMVGKAIRHGSNGLGGRAQQIMAVVLTYFAITTSYIPVLLYHIAKNPEQVRQQQAKRQQAQGNPSAAAPDASPKGSKSFGAVAVLLLLLAAAAPFLSLGSGVSGLITLFIIFIGLQRAWKLTERSQILVMGPYEVSPAA